MERRFRERKSARHARRRFGRGLERGPGGVGPARPHDGRAGRGRRPAASAQARARLRGLAWIIVSQQVSVASATAIWGRLKLAFPDFSAAVAAGADDDALRAAGFSAAKIRTIRSVAAAIAEGSLPLEVLHAMPADDAHRLMVAVKGIGPWTADLYLLSCLGHPDAFPAGDLALQEAARLAYAMAARPTDKALAAFADRWRPWRGIAARVLWAHYAVVKARGGASL